MVIEIMAKNMHPIRRILSSIIGLLFLLAGSYMFFGWLFLGFGGKIWMYVASSIGVFIGGYLIWEDGLSPFFESSKNKIN